MDIFTIGYQGADPDRLTARLAAAGVSALADVRAVALSRKRGFSKGALASGLAESGIAYRHFRGLGTPKAGREAARAGDAATMHGIFCEQLETPDAQADLAALAAFAGAQPVCLLCFERDPALCHRRIVAERLEAQGFTTVDLFAV